MNEFQGAAIALCTVGLACGMLQTLVPDGAMKRVFSVLAGVFFFVCLLSPLSELFRAAGGFLVQSTAPPTVPTELEERVEEQVEAVLESSLLANAQEHVSPYGVTVVSVQLQRDTTRNDSIYIQQIRVVFSKEDFPVPAQIDTMLEQAWGTAVEVYYGE